MDQAHPNHHSEDVIEENGEETLPHEAFYSAVDPDYSASKQPFVPQSIQIAKQNSKYSTMGVIPGPILRGCIDIFSFVFSIIFIILQMALIDYYFISYLRDKAWLSWAAGDILLVVSLMVILYFAMRKNQQYMEESSAADGRVHYAWLAWLLYSLLLVSKMATCFRLFYQELPPLSSIQNSADNYNGKILDDHLLKLALCLSALVFVFLLEAHHYTPLGSARQLYITYLMTAIALDILDTVSFVDLLWQNHTLNWHIPLWLEITILCVGCANFVLPTFALLKLRFSRNQRILMISDRFWSFVYVLLVNAPFLGFRIYLYIVVKWIEKDKGRKYDGSIFAIKNIAMIYIAIRELWVRLNYWRQKRRDHNGGSQGALTAQGATDHDDN